MKKKPTKKVVKTTIKKEEKIVRIDLGCGENCQVIPATGEKFIGVDKFKVPGVDIVHDLTKFPWPFKNNSVDEVFCSHFVEHLTGAQRIEFFNELYRIMKVGGKARIITPYYHSTRAIQDPTHQWPPICESSYAYWNKAFRVANKLEHYLGATSNFEVCFWYIPVNGEELNIKNEERKKLEVLHYNNVIADLSADMVKI
jgi:SAM-dependent methyltransferase